MWEIAEYGQDFAASLLTTRPELRRRPVRLPDVGSHQTSFGSLGLASGSAPPAFHQTKQIGTFHHSYKLDPADLDHPTLQIDATDLVSTARSPGLGIDSVSTQATSDIGSTNILLTDDPALALGILGLSVAATFVHSEASASYVFGINHGFLSGDASFGSLAIGGGLIGKTLTFAGEAKANTIIFQSSSITITLDKQIRSAFLPPSAAAATAPNRITTDALDIHLSNAHLFGKRWRVTSRLAQPRLACSRRSTPSRLRPRRRQRV